VVADAGAGNCEVEEEWLVLEAVDIEVDAKVKVVVEAEVEVEVEVIDMVLGSDVDTETVG
jgi:hypothetical protein